MSGSQLTARIKEASLKGPSLILTYVPLLCCISPLLSSCRSTVILKGEWLLFMQIGPPPNKSFQGLSIILNRCAERHLLWICRVWQPWFNRRKRGAGTKKICTNVVRKPFFGTDTRWEPVKTSFVGLDIFTPPESVPHK